MLLEDGQIDRVDVSYGEPEASQWPELGRCWTARAWSSGSLLYQIYVPEELAGDMLYVCQYGQVPLLRAGSVS